MTQATPLSTSGVLSPPKSVAIPVASQRLIAIDALRGFVMVIMLLDHVRETIFLHHQVSDPMAALTTDPALFFTRISSMLCAPVFVFLTGLSAWLYGQNHTKKEVSAFLIKRGAFLMLLELFVVGIAWSGNLIPHTFWLQVIWAIGLCMIVLSSLIYLPRKAQIALGLVIVCGHNLLDGIKLDASSPFFVPWAMLHQRDVIHLGGDLIAKTTYPILPWIGVMLLGYAMGPWYAKGSDAVKRQKNLIVLGIGLVIGFVLLRALNVYGDKPWFITDEPVRTVMSFLALTKYPPSLLFLMPTIGVGLILLSVFEKAGEGPGLKQLAILGGAPMFFYLLHLFVLKAFYLSGVAIWGLNQGAFFGVSVLWPVWVMWLVMIVPLYFPARWFSNLKKRRKDLAFLRYL
ncbi:DUF1624 domain-containing protein [Asticcacaulis endophyticus]|uniref:Membrane protein n=1 Tax=Asticcacaulis endophyticus TaxID=1395890 RepID=A0A918Q2V4_9CAUL|nr:heparan-alpha-glucosaminide N-acetyltransferase domain-containing protein [Asticcacaulis endophyticus]GGZ31071.1 membrane protein [Asticcacaulis endophyticus]